jgi:PHP family Zn ribbon phosphoesterase
MDIEHLDKWARIKGIKVLGTGDFTHPLWLKELKESLEPAEKGLFKLRNLSLGVPRNHDSFLSKFRVPENDVRFMLTAEISCIYSKNNKTRKVHLVILAPSFEVADKINAHLGWIGNLKSDGRPILGLDAKEALKIILGASEDCLVVPAHAWTPHFSVFGSASGFDSLEECFDEYTKYIYAIETGLSSDPAMNWRLSQLDEITLISNSDSHSPMRIGREANVLDAELNYFSITDIFKKRGSQRFLYTIEFFPEEGKYHYDGHRNCKISFNPEETKGHKGICPVCGKSLTIGVMYRVEQLADRPVRNPPAATQLLAGNNAGRPEGGKPEKTIPFKNLIPLDQIIADALGMGVASKKAQEEYRELINRLGAEFKILLEDSREDISSASSPEIAEGVMRVREGRVKIEPGYDGEYGKIEIFGDGERGGIPTQKSLF